MSSHPLSGHSSGRLVTTLAFSLPLLLSGCGPAAIGLGLSGLNKGGGTTAIEVEVPVPPALDISVPDPAIAGNVDVGQPRPCVPLQLKVNNLNSAEITVRAVVRYVATDGVQRDATLVTGNPANEPTFSVPARSVVTRYVLWKAIADEGAGLRVDDPASAVQLIVSVERVDNVANVPPTARASLPVTAVTSINTPIFSAPFLTTPGPTQLFANEASEKLQATSSVGGVTRDLFYGTRISGNPNQQVLRLNCDQQFEAVQITNLQPEHLDNFSQNGLNLIIPTDFVPGLPDCLVQQASDYRFVTWDAQGAPTASTVFSFDGANYGTTDPVPISFKVPTSQGEAAASLVFLTNRDFGLNQTPIVTTLELKWQMLIRDPGANPVAFLDPPPSGSLFTPMPQHPAPQPFAGAPVSKDVRYVYGEFDTDPSTVDVVVGNFGTELANGGVTAGLFDLLRFQVVPGTGSQLIASVTPTRIQLPPPPPMPVAFGNEEVVRSWRLALGRRNGQQGLVLARQTNVSDTVQVFWLPAGTGDFSGQVWQVLLDSSQATSPITFPANTRISAVFARDIDGAVGGTADSEILLLGNQKLAGQPDNGANIVYAWVLATRQNRPPVWRKVIEGLEPPLNPVPPVARSSMRITTDVAQFTDVNGDQFPDLLLFREDQRDNGLHDEERWYYLPNALRGVATGFAVTLATAASRAPAFDDIDDDADNDIIANVGCFLSDPTGFTRVFGGLRGSSGSSYHLERVLLAPDRKDYDILSYDQNPASDAIGLNRVVDRPATGLGVDAGAWIPVPFAGSVVFARPVMAPDSLARGAKDVFLICDVQGVHHLYRAQFSSGSYQLADTGMVVATTARSFERLRHGDVDATRLLDNTLVEDVAFVDPQGAVVVLEAENGYAPRMFTVGGASEAVVGLAGACLSADRTEDLAVATRAGAIVRVRALLRDASAPADKSLAGTAAVRGGFELMRAKVSDANGQTVRAFSADRHSAPFAQSCIVMGGTEGGDIRFLQPYLDNAGQLVGRVLRCPTGEVVTTPLGMSTADQEGDGLLEVVAGDDVQGGGPVKLVSRGL